MDNSTATPAPSLRRPLAYFCHSCDYQLNGIPSTTCPECGRPFDPNDLRTVLAPGLVPPQPPWTARWSLVCGMIGIVLSYFLACGPVLGVTGIIFGHTALVIIKRTGLPDRSIAIAGLITSYFAIAAAYGLTMLRIHFGF